jgi:hypothetical protein
MKAATTLAALLTLSAPAAAQDSKYAGTGMSVTGPASEKKAPTAPTAPLEATSVPPADKVQHGSNGTSEEETNGVNSATSNSH